MKKVTSILIVLIISLFALFFLGARTYYRQGGHMMGGMHGYYNTGQTGDYGIHGYGMMGAGMMNFGYGMMGTGMGCSIMGSTGIVDYYLYNKDEFNLSKKQTTTLTSIKDKYYRESLALHRELYEKNFELERILAEKDVDLSKVKSLINEIGSIESEIRYKGIESFTKARNVLTEEQTNKLDTEIFRRYMH